MKRSICLNMIVKDEAEIIERCLSSVREVIDSWVIVDTGSQDGTQKIIQEFLKEIPGKLYQRKWVDFATNRNQALRLAQKKAEYSLFIDADQRLVLKGQDPFGSLKKDGYLIQVQEPQSFHYRIGLVRNNQKSSWRDVVHEHLDMGPSSSIEKLESVWIDSRARDSARALNPKIYQKDAALLRKALKKDPNHPRYLFNLGRSYFLSGELKKSLFAYKKRMEITGYEEETFLSTYFVGLLIKVLKGSPKEYLPLLQKAHQIRPSRAEPVYQLSLYYLQNERFEKVYNLLKERIFLSFPQDTFYVDTLIRDGLMPYLFAISADRLSFFDESHQTLMKIRENPDIPEGLGKAVCNDLEYLEEKYPELRR